jgi:hypothetical protein
MAYASSFPQRVPYSTDASVVRFAPIQDSESGDDMLEPPFVRVRAGNSAFMYIDTGPDTQLRGGFNDASWIVGQGGSTSHSNLDARKVKRQATVGVNFMYATPCVNPTNNTIIFRVSANPLVDIVCTVPTYDYQRLYTSRRSPVAFPTNTAIPPPTLNYALPTIIDPLGTFQLFDGFGNEVDPEDGIITKMAAAMSTASGVQFNVIPSDGYRDTQASNYQNTNCLFWRIVPSVGTFIFTGGSVFTRGQFTYGVAPIIPTTDFTNLANYYGVYAGGPVSFLYTRWIDLTSRVLLSNTKMPLSGTDIPVNTILRIYCKFGQKQGIQFFTITDPIQWINWRNSQAINAVDLQMRDEFGELLEIPQRANNASWVNLILLNQL